MKKHLFLAALASTLISFPLHANDLKPKGPDEDGTKPALTSIAGQGFYNSSAFAYLTELSDNVGGRVTGSPAGQKAIDWGLSKMKTIGLSNVHDEKWSLWRGWTRGAASAQLVAPLNRTLTVDAMGWTGSTAAGGVEAEVVTDCQ